MEFHKRWHFVSVPLLAFRDISWRFLLHKQKLNSHSIDWLSQTNRHKPTCLIFSSPSKASFWRCSTSRLYSCRSSLSISGACWLSFIIWSTVFRSSCISWRNFRLISANFLASSRWVWNRKKYVSLLGSWRRKRMQDNVRSLFTLSRSQERKKCSLNFFHRCCQKLAEKCRLVSQIGKRLRKRIF